MVQVRAQQPVNQDGSINLEAWLDYVQSLDPALQREGLRQACEFARDTEAAARAAQNIWKDGVSSYRTGLQIAEILADLKLDQDSLVAAIIYRAVREGKTSLVEVEKRFGAVVSKLIDGVQRMAAISASLNPRQSLVLGTQTQVDNLRKMLVAMVDDVRVALIKLAERTCAIREVKDADEDKRYRVAREVFDIYAPLAHRLGIGHIKWELEDLSFRYLEPQQYKQIAALLHERRLDREQYINDVMSQLRGELDSAGIQADISGRAKHIYSIWRKMQKKGLQFSQIYDVRAVRVLVPEVRDCYTTLGIVHSLWRHIPKEFDDYIANPKENGYRSLHTAVIGPDGQGAGSADPDPRDARGSRAGCLRALALQGHRRQIWLRSLRRKDRLAAPGARVARGAGRHRRPGRAVAGRYRARPGLCVHPRRPRHRPAQGRHAAGFCLLGTHRDRPQLPGCQGQRAHRAAQLQPADRRAGGDHHQQERRTEP